MIRGIGKKASAVTAAAGLAALAGWFHWVNGPTGVTGTVTVEIVPGMSASRIAEELEARGLISDTFFFKLYAKLTGIERNFKAGKHPLEGNLTTVGIARRLTRNPPVPPDIRVTVIEGLNIRETASVLAARAGIDSAAFVSLATDGSLAAQLGVDNDTLEGYLYPDTYFIRPDTEPVEMIRKMVARFHEVFCDSLRKRAAELGMTVSEVVTLASIIETEVSKDEERPLVSAVFHRRLRLNMPLEANSTVQYALGVKRRVLYEDLGVDSPYNTYIHAGLPPGPIASPGKKSLLAALYPADTDYLYFVADGNGGHVFSRTMREHTKAVRRYRRAKRSARAR